MNFVLRTAHAEEKKKSGHTNPDVRTIIILKNPRCITHVGLASLAQLLFLIDRLHIDVIDGVIAHARAHIALALKGVRCMAVCWSMCERAVF